MISLCPGCNTEQMVTAIELQERRGEVACEACGEAFMPRAHRVTAARERAFKKNLKELDQQIKQCETQMKPAAVAAKPPAPIDTHAASEPSESTPLSAIQETGATFTSATQRLIEELSKSVSTLNNRVTSQIEHAASYLEKSKSLQNSASEIDSLLSKEETIVNTQRGLPVAKVMEKSSGMSIDSNHNMQKANEETRAAEFKEGQMSHAKSTNEGVDMANVKDTSQILSREEIQQRRLHKVRHAMAREKLLLDYEKLKVENQKLEIEKKKLELERVKLEILAKHKLLEAKREGQEREYASKGPALDGRPVIELSGRPIVEYDIKTDLLPRTPNAIDHGKPANKKGQKVHLELMPSEPQTLFRKNLAMKNKSEKAKH